MRVGIVGTGMIVHEFLEMQRDRTEIEVTAIVSRPGSRDKLEALAGEYGIPAVYTDYARFLEQADMDIVYVGISNSLHYEYAKSALLANRNVILEKPFTVTAAEAASLADIAWQRGLFLFEAITLLHFPNYAWIREHLDRLGRLTMVQINFSQYSSRYDRYLRGEVLPAFDPSLAGGALMDLNIYNLHLAVGLLGKPEEVIYRPRLGFNGIDTSGVALLTYPDFAAVLTGAKDSGSPCFALFQGEKGYLRVDGVPSQLLSLTVKTEGEERTFSLNERHHRMTDEMLEFDRILRENDRERADALLRHSLTVMEVADAARESGGIRFAADR